MFCYSGEWLALTLADQELSPLLALAFLSDVDAQTFGSAKNMREPRQA
jgi:hypothetical protein